jgi:tRNA pseudouridine38/39 synthase
MAAVLLMVGRGEEKPDIVGKLLDLKATPSKPYYNMAAEVANVTNVCTYGMQDLDSGIS